MDLKALLWAALALQLAWAQPLPPAAPALYDKSRVRTRHQLLQAPAIEATSDGQSFVAIWEARPNPKKWIVSLHGSRGLATEEMAVWQPHLKDRQVGLLCLQWRLGEGDGTRDYMTPEVIYREVDLALQRHGVAAGQVLLHGFSRGSTQTFALAALDVFSRRRYFDLVVASSGGVSEGYPPTRDLLLGKFGPRPLQGTRWVTAAGAQDENPERDGIPAMRRTAEWLRDQGAVVVDTIEVAEEGHGALQRSSKAMNRLLKLFLP